jgi:hypothetical protein
VLSSALDPPISAPTRALLERMASGTWPLTSSGAPGSALG